MKSLSKGNGGNRAAKVGNRAVSVSYVSIVWYETRNIAGRNTNKINEAGLTIETAENIDVPAIKEYPLTLECKIIYKQAQDPSEIPPEDAARFYPQNVDSSNTGANKDYHILYHAEIVKSYIIQE